MRVLTVVVGRVRSSLRGPVAEYENRASRYWRTDVVEVAAGRGRGRPSPAEAEAELLLARVPSGFEMVALTRKGRAMSSKGIAAYLSELALRSSPGVAFLIGGAEGLHPRVLARASRMLCLSALTLPHELARLVLAEQLYRAGTIVRGEPYHKGQGR